MTTKEEFNKFLKGINKSNINERMLNIPSQVFDHNYNCAIIVNKVKELQAELEELMSALSAQTRRGLDSRGTKGYTETRVKDIVIAQTEVIALKAKLREEEKKARFAKSYIEALRAAREVLPNVSNNFREERRVTEKTNSTRRRRT